MRLPRSQQDLLLQWAAEGLALGEINKRASECDPPFKVDYLQLKHARTKAPKNYVELREQFEEDALKYGLARRAIRLRHLESLLGEHLALIKARGEEMASEVAGGQTGLMARDYKGKDADRAVYKYDAPLVREIRGILDDIARELGERKSNVDLNASGELVLKVQYGDDGNKGTDDQAPETARPAESLSE